MRTTRKWLRPDRTEYVCLYHDFGGEVNEIVVHDGANSITLNLYSAEDEQALTKLIKVLQSALVEK